MVFWLTSRRASDHKNFTVKGTAKVTEICIVPHRKKLASEVVHNLSDDGQN